MTSRRTFLHTLTGLAGTAVLPAATSAAPGPAPVSCNQYTWLTFFNRENRDWFANLDASLGEYVQTGLTAFEPSFGAVDEVRKLAPLLKKHGLAMPSFYTNSTLHTAEEANKTIPNVLAIAEAAKPLGAKIVVTNPNPIRWNSDEAKTDAQLAEQAANLDKLGAELRRRGLTLAYHTHAPEMHHAAREFHHSLLGTDPKNVALCLDTHWVYRGASDSQVALFDIVKLYADRIVELHLRQSKGGVWQETFGEGDIDYPRLARALAARNVRPLLVLEQCLEKNSPQTTNAVAAQRVNLAYTQKVFGG
jgi:inosose dehydratase